MSGGKDELVEVGGGESRVRERVGGDEVMIQPHVLLVGVGRASSVRRREDVDSGHRGGRSGKGVGGKRKEGLRSKGRRVEEGGRRAGGRVRRLREKESLSSELSTSEREKRREKRER